MKTPQLFLPLALAASFVPALSGQTTLLNDSFADGNRTGQSLPSSAAWYQLGSATVALGVDSAIGGMANALAFSQGGSAVALSYFTNSGVQSLTNVNDSITLRFDFRIGGLAAGDNVMRIALLNSGGGTRVSADDTASIAAGTGYTGYALFMDTDATATAQFRKHTGADILGFANYTTVGTAGSVTAPVGGTIYTGNTLTITRTASGVSLSGSIAGSAINASDTTGAITAFDTVAFRFMQGASYRFDNVSVSAIPEPSAFAAWAGLGTIGLAASRRRRRGA